MSESLFDDFVAGMKSGSIVPYLGPYALKGSVNKLDGKDIPADSDSLIYAMNNGQPMAPRLMYEFPRAAMNLELKKGRSFVNNFLSKLYGEQQWTRAPMHDFLATIMPSYVVDINRDTQLQETYADVPHTLICGISRTAGISFRFEIHDYDGKTYTEVSQEEVDTGKPVLFKPMGTPLPKQTFIASDADYVDYITELMGGFAIPGFLKDTRIDKQYLLMGVRLTRDTERMVLSDIIYNAKKPVSGWACIDEPNAKEARFCKKIGLEVIDISMDDLLSGLQGDKIIVPTAAATADMESANQTA